MVMSRSLKPIPNRFVQEQFGHREYNGMDGELIIGDPYAKDVYRDTVSGVMSQDGLPNVRLFTFDNYLYEEHPFVDRIALVHRNVEKMRFCHMAQRLEPLNHERIHSVEELNAYEAWCLELGYEGAMIRSETGPYKFGRSTEREGWLLKVKRFDDSEAIITGMDEKFHNANEATVNELGHTHRSSHKAGKELTGVLGALKVRGTAGTYNGVEFDIGTGFDDALRAELWGNKEKYVGKLVKYKFFPSGSKDRPRFPTFLGFMTRG
jgi:DNA ligase-1